MINMLNQKDRETLFFKLPIFIMDVSIHFAVLCLLLHVLPTEKLGGLSNHSITLGVYSLLFVAFSTSVIIFGLRLHERRIKASVIIWRALGQTLVTSAVFILLLALVYRITPRYVFYHQFITAAPLIILLHYLSNKGVRLIRKLGRNIRRTVIVGADETSRRLYKELNFGHDFTGYRVSGFFSSFDNAEIPEGATLLGTVEDCYDWIAEHKPDEVYCSLPPALCSKEVNRIIKICNDNFLDFYYVPTMDGYPHRQMEFKKFGRVNIIQLRPEPLNSAAALFLKRTFDIAISLVFLCTVYPFVLLFVWIGNKITGNVGPIYFKQARTGYNGQSFLIYKFRSMKVNADADKLQATENDPRKTPFGDFMRRSSIDELPQFINVLKGDMSIVGPRPHMEYHTEMYSELIGNYMVRHLAKPGITGWAQINGCRGETKTVAEMADRVEHDIWYIEHWTPILDLEIMFRTAWQILPGHDKQAY